MFQAQISKLGMLFGHETHVEAIKSIVVYETQFFKKLAKLSSRCEFVEILCIEHDVSDIQLQWFFFDKVSTFLSQKIGENLEVFVVSSVHFLFGGVVFAKFFISQN